MNKDIKKILKRHSMFQDQSNGFRLYSLHRDKWDEVAKDIEKLVNENVVLGDVISKQCDNKPPIIPNRDGYCIKGS